MPFLADQDGFTLVVLRLRVVALVDDTVPPGRW